MEESTANDVNLARTRRLAAWSLGLGVAGLLTVVFGIGVLLALAALILGAIVLTEIRTWQPNDGHGVALCGIAFALAALLAFPILLATVVPRFISWRRAQHQEVCYSNLQAIAEAKARWATEHRATTNTVVRVADLGSVVAELSCPGEGRYKINPVGTPPQCSIVAHNDPPPSTRTSTNTLPPVPILDPNELIR